MLLLTGESNSYNSKACHCSLGWVLPQMDTCYGAKGRAELSSIMSDFLTHTNIFCCEISPSAMKLSTQIVLPLDPSCEYTFLNPGLLLTGKWSPDSAHSENTRPSSNPQAAPKYIGHQFNAHSDSFRHNRRVLFLRYYQQSVRLLENRKEAQRDPGS